MSRAINSVPVLLVSELPRRERLRSFVEPWPTTAASRKQQKITPPLYTCISPNGPRAMPGAAIARQQSPSQCPSLSNPSHPFRPPCISSPTRSPIFPLPPPRPAPASPRPSTRHARPRHAPPPRRRALPRPPRPAPPLCRAGCRCGWLQAKVQLLPPARCHQEQRRGGTSSIRPSLPRPTRPLLPSRMRFTPRY